jgi:hypothetical protein
VPCSLSFGPGLEALDLPVKIRPLIMSADPRIEDEQSAIRLAEQALNFGSGNTGFDAHPNRLNFACFDPASNRDRMEPQFLRRFSYPKVLSITFSHDKESIT